MNYKSGDYLITAEIRGRKGFWEYRVSVFKKEILIRNFHAKSFDSKKTAISYAKETFNKEVVNISEWKEIETKRSKLLPEEVNEIETLYFAELEERAKGKGIQLTQEELAKRFEVSQTTIKDIINKKVWR